MGKLALAVVGGEVATEKGLFAADIGVRNGKIDQITSSGDLGPAEQSIDATGMLVMPGVIDIHWHCRAPDNPERGDFATETRAAAAGGATTVMEMPISKPACATPEIFRKRRALGEQDSYVNFALYGAPGTLAREDVLGMASEGAIGFKIFTIDPPAGREDDFLGLCLPDEGDLYQALTLVKETGLRCSVHAESAQLVSYFTTAIRNAGRSDPMAHPESRPPIVEAVAITKLILMAEALDVPIHIAHLSSRAGLDLVRHAQARGVPITAETCPQYLFFDKQIMLEAGPYAKINPPLRERSDVEALWSGLDDGVLSAVATDHAPFLVEEKERGWNSIWEAPPGSPATEIFLSIMMDAAAKGQLTVPQVVRLLCGAPARLFSLFPQKGIIQIGSDADLTVFDPRQVWTVDPEKMHSKARFADRLYRGMELTGRVGHTIVGGKEVYRMGEIVGERGGGAFVRPIFRDN